MKYELFIFVIYYRNLCIPKKSPMPTQIIRKKSKGKSSSYSPCPTHTYVMFGHTIFKSK